MNRLQHRTRLEPGIHQISPTLYHADPAITPSLSSGCAKLLLDKTPAHAWEASALNPDRVSKDTQVFDIGRAAHRVVLGVGDDIAQIPTHYLGKGGTSSTKAAQEFIAEARSAGMTPLKPEIYDSVMDMAHAVRVMLRDRDIALEAGRSELTAIAEIDGAICRAMVDSAPEHSPVLYDLKTCVDASDEGIRKAIERNRLDVQASHYRTTWQAATGEVKPRTFRFVFIEKEKPHAGQIVQLHDDPGDEADWYTDADHKVEIARWRWNECLGEDHWPAYPGGIKVIGASTWYKRNWHDQELPDRNPDHATIRRATDWQRPEDDN